MVLVICVVLLAFGYSGLPFWPQGKPYDAYFTAAGGISPGNAVYVSGFKVGQVQSVGLAGDSAKVTFTVDRHVAVGDQSLAAIRTGTILGERSIAVSPAGRGKGTTIPLSRTTTPYTLAGALEDLAREMARCRGRQVAGPARQADRGGGVAHRSTSPMTGSMVEHTATASASRPPRIMRGRPCRLTKLGPRMCIR